MCKIIIAGGRNYSPKRKDIKRIIQILRENRCDCVVSGMANGADLTGELIAESLGIDIKSFPADWGKLGKPAGFIRNKQMADYADEVILLPGAKAQPT
jgi:hypothetical protein